jgi:hypothetical protein
MPRSLSAFAIPVALVTPSARIVSITEEQVGGSCCGLLPSNGRPSLTPEFGVFEVLHAATQRDPSATIAMMPTVRRLAFGMSAAVKAIPERWSPRRKCASRARLQKSRQWQFPVSASAKSVATSQPPRSLYFNAIAVCIRCIQCSSELCSRI